MKNLAKTDCLHLAVIGAVCAIILFGIFWPRSAEAGEVCHPIHRTVLNYHTLEKFDCEYGSTHNDFLKDPLMVNIDEMFDHDDWVFHSKPNVRPRYGAISFGNWLDREIMLVLKGPSHFPYMGYHIGKVPGTLAVEYTTPFTPVIDFSPRKYHDISHMSLYYREDKTRCEDCGEMPVPSGLWLMALGLPLLYQRARRVRLST